MIDPAAVLLVCLDDAPSGKVCGGRVEWSRAVSGESPVLEQLDRDGRLASRLTPGSDSGPIGGPPQLAEP